MKIYENNNDRQKWQQDVKYLTRQPIVGKTNEMS